MVHRAAASVLPPDISNCFAGCKGGFDYQKLIVTKCNHIFCKKCLAAWHTKEKKAEKTCPTDRGVLTHFTYDNTRKKEENAKIHQKSVAGYSSPNLYIRIFAYYIRNDYSSLQKKLPVENIGRIASCKIRKEFGRLEIDENDVPCIICNKQRPQMYFIIQDKDPSKIGRFMHEGCWQETVDNESELLDISVLNMVKIAEKLPWPPKEPASPLKVFLIAIALPVSIWALAMNTRVYHNKSFALYLLSIPAMILFKLLSVMWNGLKAVFTEKHA